ncbi:HTH domain-containing protein [Moorella sp. E306M]|uniref:HTH domain-containing protein n=1 Tax=Moorella sp. E306M TaxID=2572683 RepID=UPI0010FFB26C|nr:helix-turn-helix domain-containing protein [Moorella sp. E306M]GEA18934.1 hypothetical protein E306M_20710 [Moorella sp. E306M]
MSKVRNLLNPMTGKPFAFDEYYAFDDTIQIFGLDTDIHAQICNVAAQLNIKVYECSIIEDLIAIPAFMAIVNPQEISQEDAALLFELWQEHDSSEFKVKKTSANRQERIARQCEERISRILMILKRLQKGPVKTRELAKEFKVSVRTVQRDIRILERIGEPIGYDEQEKAFFLLTRERLRE